MSSDVLLHRGTLIRERIHGRAYGNSRRNIAAPPRRRIVTRLLLSVINIGRALSRHAAKFCAIKLSAICIRSVFHQMFLSSVFPWGTLANIVRAEERKILSKKMRQVICPQMIPKSLTALSRICFVFPFLLVSTCRNIPFPFFIFPPPGHSDLTASLGVSLRWCRPVGLTEWSHRWPVEGSLGHLLASPGFLIRCTLIIASPAALACNRRRDVSSANSGVGQISRCFDIRSASMLISANDSTTAAFLALFAFHTELHHWRSRKGRPEHAFEYYLRRRTHAPDDLHPSHLRRVAREPLSRILIRREWDTLNAACPSSPSPSRRSRFARLSGCVIEIGTRDCAPRCCD